MAAQRFTIDTRLEAVADLAREVSAACVQLGLDEDAVFDVELAVVEAATNVICHGYEAKAGGFLEVVVDAEPEAVRLEVRDRGSPIPAGLLERAGIEEPGEIETLSDSGRGLALIKASVDGWEYEASPAGNRLALIKRR
jgi:serine/threonine-protein kinase RsbW